MSEPSSSISSKEQTLMERLEDCAKVTFSAGLHGVEADCKEAAAVLRLQYAAETTRAMEAVEAQETIQRLRAALKRIRDRTRMSPRDFESATLAITFAYHEALKAVGGEPADPLTDETSPDESAEPSDYEVYKTTGHFPTCQVGEGTQRGPCDCSDRAAAGTGASVADYEEVLADKRRLTRELDVLLNGAGAARQASLCDIVSQVQREKIRSPQYLPLTEETSAHRHTDACWEPDSGCDMGRNEKFVAKATAPGANCGKCGAPLYSDYCQCCGTPQNGRTDG